jgi:hypothetical protein
MSAGKYNFIIEQGTTFTLELQYKDSNSVPVDLTGYTGRMQIRPSIGSPTSYLTLSSSIQPDGTGITFPTPVSGTINLYISAISSSQLTFDQGVYDLEIATGSTVTRLIQGNVQLSKEVTTGLY